MDGGSSRDDGDVRSTVHLTTSAASSHSRRPTSSAYDVEHGEHGCSTAQQSFSPMPASYPGSTSACSHLPAPARFADGESARVHRHGHPFFFSVDEATIDATDQSSSLGIDDSAMRTIHMAGASSDASTEESSPNSGQSDRGFSRRQAKTDVPRPSNAWILYRSAKVAELRQATASSGAGARTTAAGPSSSAAADEPTAPSLTTTGKMLSPQAEMSKRIGELWRSEPQEVKDYWYEVAEQKRREHEQAFPDYKYKPRQTEKSIAARLARRKGARSPERQDDVDAATGTRSRPVPSESTGVPPRPRRRATRSCTDSASLQPGKSSHSASASMTPATVSAASVRAAASRPYPPASSTSSRRVMLKAGPIGLAARQMGMLGSDGSTDIHARSNKSSAVDLADLDHLMPASSWMSHSQIHPGLELRLDIAEAPVLASQSSQAFRPNLLPVASTSSHSPADYSTSSTSMSFINMGTSALPSAPAGAAVPPSALAVPAALYGSLSLLDAVTQNQSPALATPQAADVNAMLFHSLHPAHASESASEQPMLNPSSSATGFPFPWVQAQLNVDAHLPIDHRLFAETSTPPTEHFPADSRQVHDSSTLEPIQNISTTTDATELDAGSWLPIIHPAPAPDELGMNVDDYDLATLLLGSSMTTSTGSNTSGDGRAGNDPVRTTPSRSFEFIHDLHLLSGRPYDRAEDPSASQQDLRTEPELQQLAQQHQQRQHQQPLHLDTSAYTDVGARPEPAGTVRSAIISSDCLDLSTFDPVSGLSTLQH